MPLEMGLRESLVETLDLIFFGGLHASEFSLCSRRFPPGDFITTTKRQPRWIAYIGAANGCVRSPRRRRTAAWGSYCGRFWQPVALAEKVAAGTASPHACSVKTSRCTAAHRTSPFGGPSLPAS